MSGTVHLTRPIRALQSSPRWYSQAYLGVESWRTLSIPCSWSEIEELSGLIGAVWFRRTFYIPTSLAGKPARLLLGTIVDSDTAYLNGQVVGTTGYQYPPRKYQGVPAGTPQGRRKRARSTGDQP